MSRVRDMLDPELVTEASDLWPRTQQLCDEIKAEEMVGTNSYPDVNWMG